MFWPDCQIQLSMLMMELHAISPIIAHLPFSIQPVEDDLFADTAFQVWTNAFILLYFYSIFHPASPML